MPALEGQVAIITGAGRGIGRAIARSFATEGARLVLVGRSAAALERVRDEVKHSSDAVAVIAGDVREEDTAMRAVARAVDHLGGLHLLVNNAGIAIHKPITDLSVGEFDSVMDTNMRGTFLFSRAVVPIFLAQRRGTIVNIGSGAGTRGIATETAYCASKFAQRGFTLALDQELRPHNIRVSLILPGDVDTGFHRDTGVVTASGVRAESLRPEDVAEAVLFTVTQGPNARVAELVLRPLVDSL